MLSKPRVKFSGARGGLGLWDLKMLRFDSEQVPRNPMSWQSLSLELQRWPSLVSAVGVPRAAADLQLCTWEEKNVAPWLVLFMLS